MTLATAVTRFVARRQSRSLSPSDQWFAER
jgi:hypothetical protein